MAGRRPQVLTNGGQRGRKEASAAKRAQRGLTEADAAERRILSAVAATAAAATTLCRASRCSFGDCGSSGLLSSVWLGGDVPRDIRTIDSGGGGGGGGDDTVSRVSLRLRRLR